MTTLDRGIEDDLREAVMDEAEDALYAERDNLAFRFLQLVNSNIDDYAAANDYDLDSIKESGRVTDTSRGRDRVSATLEWGGLSGLFEFGVSPHTIDGNPLLSFKWESPPEGTRPAGAPAFVQTEQVNWGSVTGGIPPGRFIRGALNTVRFDAQGGEIQL